MPSTTSIVSAPQSQVEASFVYRETSPRFTPTIRSIRLLPRIGQAQIIEVILYQENGAPGFETWVVHKIRVTFYDQAFEEYNLYGQRRSAEADKAKSRQEEF